MRIVPYEYKIWLNETKRTTDEIRDILNDFGKDEWILVAVQHNTYYFCREIKDYGNPY